MAPDVVLHDLDVLQVSHRLERTLILPVVQFLPVFHLNTQGLQDGLRLLLVPGNLGELPHTEAAAAVEHHEFVLRHVGEDRGLQKSIDEEQVSGQAHYSLGLEDEEVRHGPDVEVDARHLQGVDAHRHADVAGFPDQVDHARLRLGLVGVHLQPRIVQVGSLPDDAVDQPVPAHSPVDEVCDLVDFEELR